MIIKYKLSKLKAGIPIAILTKSLAKELGVRPKDRISLGSLKEPSKKFFTIIDINPTLRGKKILLSKEILENLHLKRKGKVHVNLEFSSEAFLYIKKKLTGKHLSKKEVEIIVQAIVDNSLSEAELALFISLMYEKGMDFKETIFLIQAFLESGNPMKFRNKFVVDKHCVGGIPGNRTTPIVVSICASGGLTFPKSSSRAITSAAGTADVIEVLAKVSFKVPELKKMIKRVGAFLVWGGALDLVPADSKIIKIEKKLMIDPESQLLASIMSKKLAFGAKYILVDIPYGRGAKFNKKSALELKREFEKIGAYFKRKVRVVLTDGKEPIGNGIGPVLEMRDILRVLNPKVLPPRDLREKALFLAGQIFEMVGKCKKDKGYELAKKILDSGKAFKKFKEIIREQGGEIKLLKDAKFRKDLYFKKNGKIIIIKNKETNFIARIAGSPFNKPSGIYLYNHVGSLVKKKQRAMTIYSDSKSRLRQAVKYYKKLEPIVLKEN